jgi:hypothetical protein
MSKTTPNQDIFRKQSTPECQHKIIFHFPSSSSSLDYCSTYNSTHETKHKIIFHFPSTSSSSSCSSTPNSNQCPYTSHSLSPVCTSTNNISQMMLTLETDSSKPIPIYLHTLGSSVFSNDCSTDTCWQHNSHGLKGNEKNVNATPRTINTLLADLQSGFQPK